MADEEKKTSTEDAFIDDFALEIQDIDDAFEKSIAQYEFPYRDGAKLEDMGLKARKVRFKCFFFGKRYDEHKLFLEHIKGNKGLFDFTHPKYGLLHGSVESASVRHDDRLETAEIDISFVEEFAGEIEIPAVSVDGVFEQGQAEQIAEFEKDVKDELGAEAAEILGKELDPTKGILEQFTGLTATARAYVKQIDGYVSKLEATLTSIANPANSLLATIDYGVNLPGRVIGSVSRTVERYALLAESLKTAPSRFAQSMKNGMKELESALGGFSKHIHLAGSQRTALEVGRIYKADEQKRNELRRAEKSTGFDALGNFIGAESSGGILDVTELERSLSEVRSYLQEAVDDSRDMPSLKELALSLLKHVNTVKLEREKIISVDVGANPLPLHLICLKYGLSHDYAERILKINPHVSNPNFVTGEVNIYAG